MRMTETVKIQVKFKRSGWNSENLVDILGENERVWEWEWKRKNENEIEW